MGQEWEDNIIFLSTCHQLLPDSRLPWGCNLSRSWNVVVAGDFNVRADKWEMPQTNRRERYILEMVARAGLSTPSTFWGTEKPSRHNSYVQECYLQNHRLACRRGLYCQWPSSDPFYWTPKCKLHTWAYCITFEVTLLCVSALKILGLVPRFNDWKFCHVEILTALTIRSITNACNSSLPKKSSHFGKKQSYWWISEISEMCTRCLKLGWVA